MKYWDNRDKDKFDRCQFAPLDHFQHTLELIKYANSEYPRNPYRIQMPRLDVGLYIEELENYVYIPKLSIWRRLWVFIFGKKMING